MHMTWSGKLLLGILICAIIYEKVDGKRVRKHEAKIMSPPNEVPTVKCGENIKLTCVAQGKPAPEVEWWYHGQQQQGSNGQRRAIIRNLARDGRVKIKVEEMYIVRSTLIITDAEEVDEGIYQCRASNSPDRKSKGINIYQHWSVEEVPVHQVSCGESTMTRTEVIPASKYNQSVYTEAVERAITSFGVTSSSPSTTSTTTTQSTKTMETSKEKNPRTSAQMTTSTLTSETTTTTAKRLKSREPYDPRINSVLKPKKETKKHVKSSMENESNKNKGSLKDNKTVPVQQAGQRSPSQPNGNNNPGGNSGTTIHQGWWLLVLVHVTTLLFMSSSR